MPDAMIVRHCAPTLAGLKTASMFTCPFQSREEMNRQVSRLNRRLAPKGIRVLPLRYRGGRGLIYLYRPGWLNRDLQQAESRCILTRCGYGWDTCAGQLRRLRHRLESCREFPHEIGLFLGYPPEDVRGFMEEKAENYKCVGCWKVYGDPERAQRTFDRYKKCTDAYCRCLEKGRPIEGLAVIRKGS